MQRLTEIAMSNAVGGVFSRAEVVCWVGGTPDSQFGLLKRAVAAGEVMVLRRGLYALADRYLRQKLHPFSVAQRIYGPSYISLESALSFHGWIPEAVYATTSASAERSRELDTPLGRFGFHRIPQHILYTQVERLDPFGSGAFLIAAPLKALADYVYVHQLAWESARPAVESLRVDPPLLLGVDRAAIDLLRENYPSLRVQRFLKGLGRELAK